LATSIPTATPPILPPLAAVTQTARSLPALPYTAINRGA
jgi:hypothetical protein